MKTVDRTFAQYHTDLMHLRSGATGDAARKTIENADKLLKQIRQNAVKAIHASTSCFKRDDDDKMDKHDGDDEDKNDEQEGEHEDEATVTTTASPSPTPSPTPTATTGTTSSDPQTIADNAVAAMKLVFDTAKAALPAATATPSRSPKPSRSPEPRSSNDHKDGHDQKDND